MHPLRLKHCVPVVSLLASFTACKTARSTNNQAETKTFDASQVTPNAQQAFDAATLTDMLTKSKAYVAQSATHIYVPQTPAETIKITSVTATGDGCPDGTAAIQITPDGRVYSIIFDNFITMLDPDTPDMLSELNCQIDIGISHDKNLEVMLLVSEGNGYYNIAADPIPPAEGVEQPPSDLIASQTAIYSIIDANQVEGPQSPPQVLTLTDPLEGPFQFTHPVQANLPHDCAGRASIRTRLAIKLQRIDPTPDGTPRRFGYISLDTQSGGVNLPSDVEGKPSGLPSHQALYFGVKKKESHCLEQIFLPTIMR